MKRLVIDLTDEQFSAIQQLMARDTKVNWDEETNGDVIFTLESGGGLTSLHVKMNRELEFEDVPWRFEQ